MTAQRITLAAVLAHEDSGGGFGITIAGWVVGIVIGGVVGYFIGKSKNREVLGAVLGALLGCIGWIIIAVIPRNDSPS